MEWHQKRDPSLRAPYRDAEWPAATINLGPKTVTSNHRDEFNLAGGQCGDVGAGPFKWSLGGHLVLHEIQKVMQLRPGRMVLFPSAIITHENLPIAMNDLRYSLTTHLSAKLITSYLELCLEHPFQSDGPQTLWELQRSLLMTLEQTQSFLVRAFHTLGSLP